MATFDAVRRAEEQEIAFIRKLPNSTRLEGERIGLAFSGGGIRSATFNLGVLQGLARYGLLKRIDYLSTVSGGGYIGSWLAAWIRRARIGAKAGIDTVEKALPAESPSESLPPPTAPYKEPEPVNFLRDYSNYLTPRVGIFGADTWAAIATYLRNVLLNQTILISFLAAVLLLPWLVGCLLTNLAGADVSPIRIAVFAALLLCIAVTVASANAARCSLSATAPRYTHEIWVLFFVAVPLFGSALLTGLWLWMSSPNNSWKLWCLSGAVLWAVLGAAVYAGAHILGVVARHIVNRNAGVPKRALPPWQWFLVPLFALFAGAFGGLLFELISKLFVYWKCQTPASGIWHAVSWGTPLMVVAFLLAGGFHIGLLKFAIRNEEQEWWSRLSGWLMIWCIAWAGIFGLALFAPWASYVYHGWIKSKLAVLLGWLLSTGTGILGGKSDKTSGKAGSTSKMELAVAVAPYVFIIGLLALLSLGVRGAATYALKQPAVSASQPCQEPDCAKTAKAEHAAPSAKEAPPLQISSSGEVAWNPAAPANTEGAPGSITFQSKFTVQPKAGEQPAGQRSEEYWKSACTLSCCKLLIALLGLAGFALALSWRVDINEFSMNLLYRNRLVRCYLGASRDNRHPNAFTGFDPLDDVLLAELSNLQRPKPSSSELPAGPYDGPYPILNCALNVTHGQRLAWQERKVESFVFTPRFCGVQYQEMTPIHVHGQQEDGENPQPKEGYRETLHYAFEDGGPYLGTALSVSGAAVSPNMGYHTSPPLAFLMSVFDVRLGQWLGNPRRKDSYNRPGPKVSLLYLLSELFALTDDTRPYVYLSDGDHFENLALYELVRRRCTHIIACDVGADAGFSFHDLGNAIRKCRSDLGVSITLDTELLKPKGDDMLAKTHGVVGTIHYPDGGKPGKLLFIKSTVTEDDPRDVFAYRAANPVFPNQSTADQWFDESQFESYRILGWRSIESILGTSYLEDLHDTPMEKIFSNLPAQWKT